MRRDDGVAARLARAVALSDPVDERGDGHGLCMPGTHGGRAGRLGRGETSGAAGRDRAPGLRRVARPQPPHPTPLPPLAGDR